MLSFDALGIIKMSRNSTFSISQALHAARRAANPLLKSSCVLQDQKKESARKHCRVKEQDGG